MHIINMQSNIERTFKAVKSTQNKKKKMTDDTVIKAKKSVTLKKACNVCCLRIVRVQTKRGRPMLWCSLSSIQIISDVSQNQLSAAKPL